MYLWRRRLQQWGTILLGTIALAICLGYLTSLRVSKIDTIRNSSRLSGTVISRHAIRNGNAVSLQVHLENGRDVSIRAWTPKVPNAGSKIRVSDTEYASGRHDYRIVRMLE